MLNKFLLIFLLSSLFFVSCSGGGESAAVTAATSHSESSAAFTKEVTTVPVTEPPSSERETESLIPEAERWLITSDDPDCVVMTEKEIASENERMRYESKTLVDLMSYEESISGGNLSAMLKHLGEPTLPKYTSGGRAVTEDEYYATLLLRGENTVKRVNRVRYGIVTERADMRQIPCDIPYYSKPGDQYDMLQLTEVPAFSPVVVLHSSTDGNYLLAQTYNYFGWIAAGRVAVTEDPGLWKSFADPKEFLTVTAARLTVGDAVCDMGVRLPLSRSDGYIYEVTVPERDSDGMLTISRLKIPCDGVQNGNLPFTYRNFISQVFKYKDTEYSWGGRGGGVDCSGFVSNVMSTFGFRLPRDTVEQCRTVGSHEDVRGEDHETLARRLRTAKLPTAVYYRGHTLFYLGFDDSDGSFNFIHAPRMGERVSLTKKYNLSGMTYICTFGDV